MIGTIRRAGRVVPFFVGGDKMELAQCEKDARNFSLQVGEFSVRSDEAFEKHLERLTKYIQCKDKGLSSFGFYEPIWYQISIKLNYVEYRNKNTNSRTN